MMTHIPSETLLAMVFDNHIDAEQLAHLSVCAECRRQMEELKELHLDLEIARRSQPAAAALDRYQAMFSHVQTTPSPLLRAAQRLRALLTWDSRSQPALQGVRSGGAHTYRQLYVAEDAEIELMVERAGEVRRVEGDLIRNDPSHANSPTLIELLDAAGETVHAVETDDEGLFRFDNVAPGIYTALFTHPQAATIEVPALEVA